MSRLTRMRSECLVFEAFEPRILYSADLSPLALAAMGEAGPAQVQPVAHATPAVEPARAEIAFVDMSLPDAQGLIDDLQAQARAGRPIEVVQIAADEDGIARIDSTLAGRSGLTAVHVLSHGSDGVVQLGKVRLDAATLLARAGEVAQWGSALNADADLLLYGCDVAARADGQALIGQLAALTGADVAASVDLTGAAQQGANWTLERTTGTIETQLAVSRAEQQQWQGTMTLLATEGFASSGNLNGQGGGTGWADNWTGGGSGKLQVTGSGLSDPTGALPVSGGSVKLDASTLMGTASAVRNLTTTVGAAGTTTWISFLIKPDTLGLLDYAGVQFGSPSATIGFAGYSGSTFGVTVFGSASFVAAPGASAQSGTSALLVVKLQHAVGNDTITLYVNPTPGLASPDSAATVTVTNMDLGTFTRIGIAGCSSLGNNKAAFDELRVGQSYADVTPSTNLNPPVITSNGGAATAAISVPENSTAVTTVTATDADAGSSLAYSISGGLDAAKFSVDAATGALRFIAAPNFEAPADSGADNVYNVTVRVSDGLRTDTQQIAVTVSNVNEAPIANADAYATTQDITLTVPATSGVLANDSDPEGAALNVIALGTPAHGTVSLTPALLGTATNLTNNAALDTRAAWSPSGTRIAFDSARAGNNEIYVMNADGSGLVRLTTNSADDSQAAWSPDGSKIAFMSNRSGGYEVWVMNAADGSGLTQLTSSGGAISGQPAWSPDGTKIAFTSNRSGSYDLYVMNTSGGAVTRLTTATGDDTEADWSPDGTRIAFVSTRDGNDEIYVMNADGSGQTRLTNNAAIERTPTWSPDGSKLLFSSDRSGTSQLMVMDANGANVVAVTAEASAVTFGDWSPDGRTIVYSQGNEVKSAGLTSGGGFVYTPNAGYGGTDSFTYTVADPSGLTRTGTVSVTIAARPLITSNGGGATAAVSLPENTTAVATVTATDADVPAQTLTYSIIGGADAARFAINTSTGALSFVAAPDFEAPTDAGANNVYDVIVQVSDGSLTDTQAIAVTVTDVAELPTSLADSYRLTEDQSFSANVASGWYDAAWAVRQHVGFSNSTGPTLANAVVLVTLDSASIDYARLQAAGQDLRFVDNDGTVLDYEIESWNPGSTSRVWVRVPQIDGASSSDGLWMYYGNASAASGQNASGVWGDAKAVVHLGTTLVDSSSAANPVTQGTTTVVAGEIGNARSFNGSDSFVSLGSAAAVDDLFAGGGSLSAWINPSSWGEAGYGRIASKASTTFAGGANGDGWNLELNSAGQNLMFEVGFGSSKGEWTTPTGSITLGNWQQVTVVYDSTSVANSPVIYINGVAQTMTRSMTPAGAATSDAAQVLRIGNQSGSSDRTFAGAIDEVRAYDRVLSAAQIAADARAASGTLVTLGAPQVASPGVLNNDHPNGGPALTAELVSGPTHAAAFTLRSDGTFDYSPSADYNGTDSFSYRARSGTAVGSVTTVTLNITPVNDAPVIVSNGSGVSAAISVAENGSAVTTVAASDVDGATMITYAISGGADAARFTINASTGALAFVAAPNFEAPADAGANNVYDVIVSASDGALADTQALAISVTNLNEAPRITSNGGGASATLGVAENGTAVITYAATDEDAGSAQMWSITGGADASKFTIDAATGALRFITAPNFEAPTDAGADNVYDLTVKVSDGTLADTQALAVTVTNVNEAPVITSNGGGATASIGMLEGRTAVTTVTTGDVDSGSTLTYSITGGADAAKFRIDAATGALAFVTAPSHAAPTDAGADNVYDVTVRVSDGALTDSQSIAVTVGTVNSAPVITSNGGGANATLSVAEDQKVVTTVTASDADLPAQTLVHSIVGGADAARFTINASTGALAFVAAPNFETPADADANNVYEVTVQVSDGTLVDTQALAVTVFNTNEAPVIASDGGGATANLSVRENTSAVTTVIASDVDSGSTLTYSISGGADAARFTIDAASGVLRFTAAPDFEAPADASADNIYDVTVQVTDGSLTDTQDLAVAITNAAEAPAFGGPSTIGIAENGTAVATLVATDPDAGTVLTYSIVGGADAARFSIDAATGALRFVTAPNFEAPADAGADNIYDVTVRVSDGALADTRALVVRVGDVNEAPLITSGGGAANATAAVLENQAAVAALTAIDADTGSTLSWRIVGGADAARFAIDAATGALRFDAAPNFEAPGDVGADNVYDVTVQVSDGSLVATQSIAISVGNVDEAPAIVTDTLTISEGGSATPVIVSSDPDTAPGRLVYTVSGLGGGHFELTTTAGVALSSFTQADVDAGTLRFVHDGGEAAPSYRLTLADDTSSSGASAALITFTNVDDAPVAAPVDLGHILEDGSRVITQADLLAGATDAEGDTLTARNLTLTSGQGRLTDLGAGVWSFAPSADWNGAVQFAFEIADGSLAVAAQASLQVDPVNDAPVLTSYGGQANVTLTIDENTHAAATVTASSVDAGETLHYAITGGADAAAFVVDATSGALRFIAAPDREHPIDANADNRYEVTVAASDGQLATSQALTVVVANVDEAPTLVKNSVVIGNAGATLVLLATDPDTPDTALVFQVTQVSGGHFEFVATPGAPVGTFTQAEVSAGGVRFVPDGSATLPSYVLNLSDGVSTSVAGAPKVVVDETPAATTVTAPLPTLANTPPAAPATTTGKATPATPSTTSASAGESATAPRGSNAPVEEALGTAPTFFDASVSAARIARQSGVGLSLVASEFALARTTDLAPPIALAEPLALPTELAFVDAGEGPHQDLGSALRERNLDQELSRLSVESQNARTTADELIVSGTAVSTGLSVGYVLWLARGGVLMATMMSAMPAWVSLDPLPVLGQVRRGKGRKLAGGAWADDEDDEDDETDSVEKLFDHAGPTPAHAPAAAPTPTREASA